MNDAKTLAAWHAEQRDALADAIKRFDSGELDNGIMFSIRAEQHDFHKRAAALVDRLSAEVEALRAENFALAAGQCVNATADEGGRPYCKELAALRADAERWRGLYRRAVNEANGLTNYVEDRPELYRAEKRLAAIEAEARIAIDAAKEQK